MNLPLITPLRPSGEVQPITGHPPAPAASPFTIPNSQFQIPLPEWHAHARLPKPQQILTLPDGTPLKLTAIGVHFIEQITGSLLWPDNIMKAYVILWAAALTDDAQEALWSPPAPEDDAEEDPVGIPAYNAPHLAAMARRWAAAVIPAGAAIHAYNLALALWNHENGTAVEVDTAAMPETDDPAEAAKKAAAGPIGSSVDSTPSAVETSSTGPASSDSHGAPTSPPTAHGSAPTDTPSSPPPPEPDGTPTSTGSSEAGKWLIIWEGPCEEYEKAKGTIDDAIAQATAGNRHLIHGHKGFRIVPDATAARRVVPV